jgi:hypothetical protein
VGQTLEAFTKIIIFGGPLVGGLLQRLIMCLVTGLRDVGIVKVGVVVRVRGPLR